MPGPVTRQQPLAAIDEALSQSLARRRGPGPIIAGFTADVASAIGTGWQPRVTTAEDAAGRARNLWQQAVAELADPRLQDLAGDLTAAEQNLPGQRPELSAPARPAALDAARQALASVTDFESDAGTLVTRVNAILVEHAAAAMELAA